MSSGVLWFCKQCKVQPLEHHKQFPLFSSPLKPLPASVILCVSADLSEKTFDISLECLSLLELNSLSACSILVSVDVEEASKDLCCGCYLYCGICCWCHPVHWWRWNVSVRGDVMLREFSHLSFQGNY